MLQCERYRERYRERSRERYRERYQQLALVIKPQSSMITKKRITIREVAHEAGVSVQTVSRVLNDRPDVAPETRLRVKEIIERLDYHPSNLAQSLPQGRSRSIGVVGFGLEYYGPWRSLTGLEQQAKELGFTLLLNLAHESEEHDVEQLLRHMLLRHVDGIIWAIPVIDHNRAWFGQKINELPLPIIFTDVQPDCRLPQIGTDNRLGGRLATEHLLVQGYQHIGLITGPLTWESARQRLLGWQDVLPTTSERQIFEGDWTAASGARGLRQLLDQYPEMDALSACNDQMALGVLQAAYQMGLRIPKDLAIVGFDNIPESGYFCPPLTTVQQQLMEQGKTAVRELCQIIDAIQEGEGHVELQSILLPPKLIIRESSTGRKSNAE